MDRGGAGEQLEAEVATEPFILVIVIVERLEVEEGDAEEEGEEGEVVEGQEGEEEEADEGKVIRGPPIVESTNIYFPIK